MIATVPRAVDGGGRFLQLRADFVPAYIQAFRDGRLQEKIERALYRPAWKAASDAKQAAIARRVTTQEMTAALAHARAMGLWRVDERWRGLANT